MSPSNFIATIIVGTQEGCISWSTRFVADPLVVRLYPVVHRAITRLWQLLSIRVPVQIV